MGGDLVWTRVPPSEPGWWWIRDLNGRAIIEVKTMAPSYKLCLMSGPVAVPVDITRGVEWSGPIPLPKEAPHA